MTNSKAEISYSERKRNRLTRNIAYLVSVITVLYYITARILDAKIQPALFITMLSCSATMLLLIHFKKHEAAKSMGLLLFMITIYMGASSEDFSTGLHLHFITASVVAATFYGFNRWPYALGFILLAFTFYLATYFYGFPWMEKREFPTHLVRLFFIINLSTGLIISSYSIFLLSKLNHFSEEELKRKENHVITQNEELRKANTELDRFVYSASHDLRAPLSSILGLVTLAELANNKTETENYLALIRGRVSTLDNLIGDIIEYSRNARQEVIPESVELTKLTELVIEGLRHSAESKEIKFKIDIPPKSTLNTDSKRLKIILNNLVSNAIKYRDQRKENSWVEIKYQTPETGPEILVIDNGLGIEPPHQEKIFNMFYRASEQSRGSGLGLYIASEAADKIGAKIQLKSTIKEGSVFTIKFLNAFLPNRTERQ